MIIHKITYYRQKKGDLKATKEKLTLSNVKKDMLDIIKQRKKAKFVFRITWIVLILIYGSLFLLAISFFLPHPYRILPPIIPTAFIIYHVIRYVFEIKPATQLKNQLIEANELSSFSVSIKKLKQISTKTVYEPDLRPVSNGGGTSFRVIKNKVVPAFYFDCGTSWRVPRGAHYEWSKDMELSEKGLDYTSVEGNEFFYISFNKDDTIAYAYNTKLFDLSPELKAVIPNN